MNIKFFTGSTDFPDYRSITSATNTQKTSAGREAGDYDKISLNKSPYPEDDMSFARVLAREAAARLEAGVSSERVLSLKQQVEGYHDRMDGILKREQVYILKLRGLEQKRLRLAEAMGWKGLTFRQILSQSTSEQAGRLSPLFTRLDSQIKHLREVKDTAERMIQVRLREFNMILSSTTGGGCDENGVPVKGPSSFFHDRYV